MGNCINADADPEGDSFAEGKAANGDVKKSPEANKPTDGNVKTSPKSKSTAATDSNIDKRRQNQKSRSTNSGTGGSIHSGLMTEYKVNVYKKYTEMEVLGNGSMGHVAKVVLKEGFMASSRGSFSSSSIDRPSGTVSSYALKSIILDRVSKSFIDELKNEIDILKAMDHPNIVRLHEVFSHKKQIYMILELCDGGDLYTRLPYTEQESAYIVGKLLSAIKYMHDHLIVHRDLKFENIMFESKRPDAEIKVIDFGLSKKFASNKMGYMREGVGTLYSMAPQVLQGVYTSQADMWSVGVITYMLLSSHRPFYNKKRKVMIDRIMRCDYTFEKDYWRPISAEAKDFIDHLLVVDPKVRYRAKHAQKHEWMHKEFKAEDRAPTESMTGRVTKNLLAYKNNSNLKKLALNFIAHRSTTADIINLRKAFDQMDTANNGVITSEEFETALLDKGNYSAEEIREMFESIDINQNGHIMYTEFIAASLEAQGELDEDRIAEAFDRLDVDKTGKISKENMMEFFGDTEMTHDEVERMIEEADTGKTGFVSFEEFLAMFRSDNESTASNMLGSLKNYDLAHTSDVMESNHDSSAEDVDESNLVGLDTFIPGGKYDSENAEQEK